jgi:hypothetical protein
MGFHRTRSMRGVSELRQSPLRHGGVPRGFRLATLLLLSVLLLFLLVTKLAGPGAGLAALPDLRTLRPALAGIADRIDPLRLQQMFAAAMLAADPVTSGVY